MLAVFFNNHFHAGITSIFFLPLSSITFYASYIYCHAKRLIDFTFILNFIIKQKQVLLFNAVKQNHSFLFNSKCSSLYPRSIANVISVFITVNCIYRIKWIVKCENSIINCIRRIADSSLHVSKRHCLKIR